MFDFLSSLRWMPILSVASLALAVLLAIFQNGNVALPIVFAIASLTLATLSKQE
jgi:hypothetical protein